MTDMYTAIGLMSGTSLDGIDAAVIRTDGGHQIDFLGSTYIPYEPAFKAQMQLLAQGDIPLNDVLKLEQKLTEYHGDAVDTMLSELAITAAEVDVVGFHGQTIRHLPAESLTWQLGNAQLLAERTGIQVVADFRRRDMAVGGEGAPLAPLYHQALLDDVVKPCAVLNLGGVANITYLGKQGEIVATDTGPASGLLDTWIQHHTGELYDDGGAMAATGQVDAAVVSKALTDIPFFSRPLPRSADRYEFDQVELAHLSLEDGAATLVALTVAGVAQACEQLPVAPKAIYVSGGGVNNTYMMAQLAEKLGKVVPISDLGLREDSLEAECFAWLAVRHLIHRPTSVPGSTGCDVPTIGGILTAPCIR